MLRASILRIQPKRATKTCRIRGYHGTSQTAPQGASEVPQSKAEERLPTKVGKEPQKRAYMKRDTRFIGRNAFWEPEEIVFALSRSAAKAKIENADMFRKVWESPNEQFFLPTKHPEKYEVAPSARLDSPLTNSSKSANSFSEEEILEDVKAGEMREEMTKETVEESAVEVNRDERIAPVILPELQRVVVPKLPSKAVNPDVKTYLVSNLVLELAGEECPGVRNLDDSDEAEQTIKWSKPTADAAGTRERLNDFFGDIQRSQEAFREAQLSADSVSPSCAIDEADILSVALRGGPSLTHGHVGVADRQHLVLKLERNGIPRLVWDDDKTLMEWMLQRKDGLSKSSPGHR